MQKLKRSNLLVPLDHTKIPNIKNLDSDYMNMSYDPHNKYSLPYSLVQWVFYIIKINILMIISIVGVICINLSIK